MNSYTFSDLFSGCGGFSLGLIDAGLSHTQAIEIDEAASESYEKNLGYKPVTKDIREINNLDFHPVDVMVGGFPCQPFSISGLQRGYFGDDGDLFQECVRAINHSKPKIFVLENVSGFARLHKGLFLRIAMRQLAALGYQVDWKIVNAVNYGVPQNRERILIMGNRLGIENFFPKPTFHGGSVKGAIDDLRQRSDAKNHEPMKHTTAITRRFASTLQGETTRDAMDRDPSLGTARITKQCYRRLIETDPAPTVVANFVTTTIHYSEHRNLTAREAARIQSFPDTFEFYGLKTRMSWQSGLSQFEQIGNAVPPLLAEAIGKSVIEMFDNPITTSNKIFKDSLFDDETLDNELATQLAEKVRSKSNGKVKRRGRTSKYQQFYSKVEDLDPGISIDYPSNADSSFELFFSAAMRRRKINVILNKEQRTVTRL